MPAEGLVYIEERLSSASAKQAIWRCLKKGVLPRIRALKGRSTSVTIGEGIVGIGGVLGHIARQIIYGISGGIEASGAHGQNRFSTSTQCN
jgi:hypothetical protein